MSDRFDPMRLRDEDPWFREVFDRVRDGGPPPASVEAIARAAEHATSPATTAQGAHSAFAHSGTLKTLTVVIASSVTWWALHSSPRHTTAGATQATTPSPRVDATVAARPQPSVSEGGADHAPQASAAVKAQPGPAPTSARPAERGAGPTRRGPATRAADTRERTIRLGRGGAPDSRAPRTSRAAEGPDGLSAARVGTATAAPTGRAESPPTAPLSELELLERAQFALRDAPEQALALTETHARDFSRGNFIQEREQIAIEALHLLGHGSAMRERADRFRRLFPASPHLRRIAALVNSAPP